VASFLAGGLVNDGQEDDRLMNQFTQEFIADFCVDGAIDWKKLVEFNSGNLNLSEIRG
jgi:hypothetical protein